MFNLGNTGGDLFILSFDLTLSLLLGLISELNDMAFIGCDIIDTSSSISVHDSES
jgi:hypothetical protein